MPSLSEKIQTLKTLLEPFDAPGLDIFSSPEQGWRMRAEFRVWHEAGDCHFAMFEKGDKGGSKTKIRCDQLPIAHPRINVAMSQLQAQFDRHLAWLTEGLYQVEFLCSQMGQLLVTFIYHRALDAQWEAQARELETMLDAHIIGRSRKQKHVLSQDFILEQFTVEDQVYTYRQYEGAFTQPNAQMCQQMLNWAAECAQQHATPFCVQNPQGQGDLLELYCGNGNFTLPLSVYFDEVLATEVSKSSIEAAKWNVVHNDLSNIKVVRLSAEEFTQAYQGVRPFQRLKDAEVDLSHYDFSTVFVDPPRMGVDENTLTLLQQFDRILYISCNPHTLAQNLNTLCHTHDITRCALFDQFPTLDHIEAGVMLERKNP